MASACQYALDASFPGALSPAMSESAEPPLPPSVARVLRTFRALGREEKMQTLLHYAKKLEPLPERFRDLDRAPFTVPECQTRGDLFPEMRDGNLYLYVDVNARPEWRLENKIMQQRARWLLQHSDRFFLD